MGKSPVDRGKHGSKIHLWIDQRGTPLALHVTGANQHDNRIVADLFIAIVVPRPTCRQHLCADKAYDAQPTRQLLTLERYHVHIPHRRQHHQPPLLVIAQPGYAPRRWVIGHTFAGSSSVVPFAPAGPNMPAIGWPSSTLPLLTFSSIWPFLDRLLVNSTHLVGIYGQHWKSETVNSSLNVVSRVLFALVNTEPNGANLILRHWSPTSISSTLSLPLSLQLSMVA